MGDHTQLLEAPAEHTLAVVCNLVLAACMDHNRAKVGDDAEEELVEAYSSAAPFVAVVLVQLEEHFPLAVSRATHRLPLLGRYR